jgi:putative spermidine/putrescine transport system permease protein
MGSRPTTSSRVPMIGVPRPGSELPAIAVVLVLFGGALLGAAQLSVQPVPGAGGVDLSAWSGMIADRGFRRALGFSAWVTFAATVVSAPLALAAAAGLRRTPLVRPLFALPALVPHLLVAVLAVLWIGPGGIADRIVGGLPLDLVRDRHGLGIVLVYVYKEVPFLTLLLLTAWDERVERRSEAAAVLGAGRWRRLTTVVWPAVRAPLILGSLIVAAFVFGAFEVPLLVGPTSPRTLATWALDATRTASLAGQSRAAAALLLTAGITLLLAALAAREARPRGD